MTTPRTTKKKTTRRKKASSTKKSKARFEYLMYELRERDQRISVAEVHAASLDPAARTKLNELITEQLNEQAQDGWEVADTLNNLPSILLRREL